MTAPIAAFVALASTGAYAQQKPEHYTERVEVARVLLDVRVLDDRGEPVRGLGVGDFAIEIGGRAARLESVEWVSGTPAADVPVLDSAAFDPAPRPRDGRLIVFVFQKSLERSRILGFMRILVEAGGVLDTLTPADRVAVLSFDSRLQIWLDFTNDFDRVRRVFQRGILFASAAPVQESPDVSLIARLDPRRARRTNTIEEALRRIGGALEFVPGVKSIVLVGHGFGRLGLNGVSMENDYDAMRDALQRARASVFALDVSDADYHSLEAGLQLVAADTGGFFARTHIFTGQAIDRLVGALAGHYALFVEQPALKGGVHAIEVKLTRRDGRVLANRTYVVTTSDRSSAAPQVATRSGAAPSCGVTAPQQSFAPPPPYPPQPPFGDSVWYGTPALWTMLPRDGRWRGLPRGERGFRQKIFVWRPGYDGRAEQWPALSVVGRRLDGIADARVADGATNAYHKDFGGWAMLVETELPTHGCWELTAAYGDQRLAFIVAIVP